MWPVLKLLGTAVLLIVWVIVLQMKGSVVDNDGRLKPADQIIGLNGQDLLTATREHIAELLKVYKNILFYLFFIVIEWQTQLMLAVYLVTASE